MQVNVIIFCFAETLIKNFLSSNHCLLYICKKQKSYPFLFRFIFVVYFFRQAKFLRNLICLKLKILGEKMNRDFQKKKKGESTRRGELYYTERRAIFFFGNREGSYIILLSLRGELYYSPLTERGAILFSFH